MDNVFVASNPRHRTAVIAKRRTSGIWTLAHASYLFLALFVGALFPFWPPYLSHLLNGDIYAHFHALTAVGWCALLIAQPLLLVHHRVHIMRDTTFAVRTPSVYLGLVATVLFAVSYLLALTEISRILVFPIAHLAWFTVVQGPPWVPFAHWFRALPLP